MNFRYCSCLKVNLNETETIWTGSYRNIPSQFTSKMVKVLFSYSRNLVQCTWRTIFSGKKNFISKIEDMKATRNLWKMRHLSLRWKILIVKTPRQTLDHFCYTYVIQMTENSDRPKIKSASIILYNSWFYQYRFLFTAIWTFTITYGNCP